MNRRAYLAAAGATAAALAGCVRTPTATRTSGENGRTAVTVEQGGRATLTVDLSDVERLQAVVPVGDTDSNPGERNVGGDDVALVWNDVTLSPSPKFVYQSYPPSWVWSSPTDVTGVFPVRAAPNAPLGNYVLRLRVGHPNETTDVTVGVTIEER